MKIGRGKHTGRAEDKISFCLNQLERAKGFTRGISWRTEVVKDCTIEEIVGALIAAEHEVNSHTTCETCGMFDPRPDPEYLEDDYCVETENLVNAGDKACDKYWRR